MALAAGVNLILSPDLSIAFARAGMLSPDGHSKGFDAAANGYVRGEGCGVVVLKRLSDALRDGDNVLALVRDPAVLLLDEPTSALDAATEAALAETIARLARTRTVITVTHRLAAVRHADQIHVVDQGQIVEQGTHRDLVKRSGLYAKLWRTQVLERRRAPRKREQKA